MAEVRTSKGGGFDSVPFQKLLYVVAIIFVIPWLWKYLRNMLQSEEDAKADLVAENPLKLKDAMDIAWQDFKQWITPVDRDNIQNAAKVIYESFNIPKHWYSWFNPGNWFEDEDKAFNALMASSGGLVGSELHDYLSICYMLVSGSERRDLNRDIVKYLDGDKYKSYLIYFS